MMDKSAKFKKLAVVCVTEFLMMRISLKCLMSPVIKGFANAGVTEPALTIIQLASFLIPILICLLYMKFTCPEKLGIFVSGGAKNSMRGLGIGLGIGLAANLTLCLAAAASGSVRYTFVGVSPLLFAVIVPCFIQCASEEVLLKGYATNYMEDLYPEDVAAFTASVLFVLHHIGNLTMCGFSAIFCLNVFVIGIVEYLLMKLTGSIWTAFGFHTAWNYTQSFIFGSENSGLESTMAFFVSSDAKASFFCDPVYGNEGTLFCAILGIVMLAVLVKLYKNKKNKTTV